jgi:ferrous-iron efflux pump FieF
MRSSHEHPATGTLLTPDHRLARLLRLATYASVGVALFLVAAKFAAWLATDAVSLLSTLIDSILDAGASMINLVAVHHALHPADREHRFGHGKAESLAGLAQAAFVSGSALFLVLEAGERFTRPRPIENATIGYAVMIFSIVLTLVLVAFQKYVIRRTDSLAISADSMHYRMDVMINAGVILSLLLVSRFGFVLADPLFAIAIAAYIFWGAWGIARASLDVLMDRELPEEDRGKILKIANSHAGVLGAHDLKTRTSGLNVFIQLHLEMDPEITLCKAHVIAEAVMNKLEEAYPSAEVLIHEDPEGVEEKRQDRELMC